MESFETLVELLLLISILRGQERGLLGYFIVDFHRTKRQKIQYARLDADETHTRYLVLRPST